MLKDVILKAASDVIFNLKVGNTPSPGNLTANLAKEISKEFENHSNYFELFANHLASWMIPVIRMNSFSVALREKQLHLLIEIGLNDGKRTSWETFLNFIPTVNQRSSDMLFQFVVTKFYEMSLIWRNSVTIEKRECVADNLEFTLEEEKVLRYVAGYIPFFLKKRYYPLQNNAVGRAVLELIDCWVTKKDIRESVNFYDYTNTWTERIDRGGLMLVNEDFYIFIRRVERVARSVLNRDLLLSYNGEDLREVIMEKFLTSELLDKSWSSLTRNIESMELAETIKLVILRKWIGMRARSFVNAFVQIAKRKSFKTGKFVSDKSEPSLRKTLYVTKSSKK